MTSEHPAPSTEGLPEEQRTTPLPELTPPAPAEGEPIATTLSAPTASVPAQSPFTAPTETPMTPPAPTTPLEPGGASVPHGAWQTANSTGTGPASAESAARTAGTAGAAGTGHVAPRKRFGPRPSPIIWGVLILAFCGYVAQNRFGMATGDPAVWAIGGVLAVGILLLTIGGLVLIRNGKR